MVTVLASILGSFVISKFENLTQKRATEELEETLDRVIRKQNQLVKRGLMLASRVAILESKSSETRGANTAPGTKLVGG